MAETPTPADSTAKPTTQSKFTAPGDHPVDAFISDALKKKFPGIEEKAAAFMEAQRQSGDETFGTNPFTSMLVALRDQMKPDMPFEDFVTKLRARAQHAMDKRNVKPYSVDVGPTKVVGPAANPVLHISADILKTIISPAWDGTVGAMRVAASPLADLPENQDPAQREAIRRGLMPPLSEIERKKGQTEVLQGLLGAAAAGQVGADVGLAKAGASHVAGLAGFVRNIVEGAGWGGAFGAAHGAGQEEAASEILNEAVGGAKAGAMIAGGLGIAGRAVGAGLAKRQAWKLSKLLADIDAENAAAAAHASETNIPDALAELMPDAGLARGVAETARGVRDAVWSAQPYSPRGELPSNTERFTNVDLPEQIKAGLSPEKVVFLKRVDSIAREKNLRFNYETGQLTPIPTPAAETAQPRALNEPTPAPAPRVNVLTSGTATIHLPAGMEADASKEMSYRLVYGDRVFSEKSAEYDLLPPEAKQKVDFWTYLDKTEGTQSAQFMRNLERSAKTRLSNRAATRGGKRFDITAASLEGAHDLTDAAVIGAAKLFRLAHLAPDVAARVWNNEMLQVLGDTATSRSALWRVYQNSQKQLDKMVQNMAPEMRDVRALMEKFQHGKAGMDWYTNGYRELHRMFGEEDATLMAHLLSIYSTGTNVDQNVTFALRDFARLKAGQPPLGGRFPANQKRMVALMLAGKPYGDQKVQNFTHLLLGGTGHSVNDVQVSRALGWVNEKFSKNQYRFVDELINGLAKDAGVSTEQYQAALWTSPRIERAQETFAAKDMKSLRYVGSFRPYHEAIRIEGAKKGIANTLVTPASEGGGGYTFDPKNMNAWKGKGYLTTLTGELVPEQTLTPGAVLKFIHKMEPIIKQYKRAGTEFTVGLWKKGDGTVSIDLNLVTPDKEKALAIGRRTDQYAIGDMTTGNYEGDVPTGKAPESPQRKVALPEVKRILKELLGGRL